MSRKKNRTFAATVQTATDVAPLFKTPNVITTKEPKKIMRSRENLMKKRGHTFSWDISSDEYTFDKATKTVDNTRTTSVSLSPLNVGPYNLDIGVDRAATMIKGINADIKLTFVIKPKVLLCSFLSPTVLDK